MKTMQVKLLIMVMVAMLSVTAFAGLMHDSEDSDAYTYTGWPTDVTLVCGEAYSVTVPATSPGPYTNPTITAVTGTLWLSAVESSGAIVITGTAPSSAGSYRFTLGADEDGQTISDLRTFNVTVTETPSYTVAFYNGSTLLSSTTVTAGSSVTVPSVSETGKMLRYWSTDLVGTEYLSASATTFVPTETISLYAVWLTATYTISYNANGGTGTTSSQTCSYGMSVNISGNAFINPIGYAFTGWNTASNGTGTSYAVGSSISPTSNIALYAQWTAAYTITTTSNPTAGGTTAGGGTYVSGTSATITATANPGYSFASWNDGNTSASRSVTVSATATYTATFTINNYTLTVTAGTGGNVTGGGSYQYNTSATLVATANTGYSFTSWSDGNTNSSRSVTVTDNATYTASFAAIDTVVTAVTATITAPVTGATPVTTVTISSTSYTVGSPTWTPTVSSSFIGGTVYSVSFNVTPADGYAVNSTTTATVNGSAATIASVDGTVYSVTYTFPATLLTYTVTYTAGTTTTAIYTEGTPLILKSAPTIENYLFIGWNTGQNGTGTNVGTAGESYTPTADITLYATYVESGNTITFDANGGTTSTATKSVATDYAVGTLPVPTYTGNIFTGWNTAADGTGTAYTADTVYTLTTGITLYAQWTTSSEAFTVTFASPTTTDPTVNLTATIAFLGESVDLSAATYNWYVFPSDSSTAMTQGFQRTFSYTFTESGTYTIKVVVSSTNYGSADYENTVTVRVGGGGGGEDDDTPYWVYAAYAVSIICGLIALISIFVGRFEIVVIGAAIAVAIAVALYFGGYLL